MDKKNDGDKTIEQKIEDTLNGGSSADDSSKSDDKKVEGETPTPHKVKLTDGRELTAEELLEEHNQLQSEFTRKSQELSRLTKTEKAVEGKEDGLPVLNERDQAILSDFQTKFMPHLRKDIESVVVAKEPEIISKSARVSAVQGQLNQSLDELEEDFDGSEEEINGVKVAKPKVNRQEILDFITENPGTKQSPLNIARLIHIDEFSKYEALKSASNGSAKLPVTESQGAQVTEPPATKPVSFRDGSAEEAVKSTIGATT